MKQRCSECKHHEEVYREYAPVVVYCKKHKCNRAAGAFCKEVDNA